MYTFDSRYRKLIYQLNKKNQHLKKFVLNQKSCIYHKYLKQRHFKQFKSVYYCNKSCGA